MTLSLTFNALSLPRRDPASIRLLCVGMAALPLGLLLDHWFGLLPALTARCGETETLSGMLAWHWACMPATCLTMLFAGPAWIGLEALARAGRTGAAQRDRRTSALPACVRHVAMLAGMAGVLCAGPTLLALAGLPWTGGAAIGAMALGMACGMGAVSLSGAEMSGPDADRGTGRRSPLC